MLYVLKDADPILQKNILKHANSDVINALAEIAINILNGNVPLDEATKNRLGVYKRELRGLACLKRKLSSKRKILVQRGRGFIAPVLATLLTSLVGSYLNKK